MKLSKEQQRVHDSLISWITSPKAISKPLKVLTGHAGTGKTTLAIKLVDSLNNLGLKTAVVTFTGKASDVLAGKFAKANVGPASLTTIHGLFFKLNDTKASYNLSFRKLSTADIGWTGGGQTRPDLILVDEMSMLSEDLTSAITKHGVPVLMTGDPGQLGAVNDEPIKLLKKPDFHLKEIHRQAAESPIIQAATKVRQGEKLAYGPMGSDVYIARHRSQESFILRDKSIDAFFSLDDSKALGRGTLLCASNKNRALLNKVVRQRLGVHKHKYPMPGEFIVCLQNNPDSGLKNGTLCKTLTEMGIPSEGQDQSNPTYGKVTVDPGTGFPKEVLCYLPGFGKQKLSRDDFAIREAFDDIHFFDFGYCLTVHKAQGSEWDSVFLQNGRMHGQSDEDYRRWLYTAVTRASNKLVVVGL